VNEQVTAIHNRKDKFRSHQGQSYLVSPNTNKPQ